MNRHDTIVNIINEIIGQDLWKPTSADTFTQLVPDSLDTVNLLMALEEALDVDFSIDECSLIRSYSVPDMLKFIDEILGPEKPTDGVLTLTDDQFIRRYKPELHADGVYYRQRDWYSKCDVHDLQRAVDAECCWTMIAGDSGGVFIEWGNRVVNRMYNIITEKPIENTSWHVQVPDNDYDDLEPDYEEVVAN